MSVINYILKINLIKYINCKIDIKNVSLLLKIFCYYYIFYYMFYVQFLYRENKNYIIFFVFFILIKITSKTFYINSILKLLNLLVLKYRKM